MSKAIDTKMLPGAIEVMNDFGFFSSDQEAKSLIDNWRKLDSDEKRTLVNVLTGATMAMAMMKK